MAFLRDKCIRVPLTDEIIKSAVPFSCGNADLDDFFSSDYADYAHQLMGKTYVYVQDGGGNDIVCAFTVSNASVFTNHLPNARKKKIGSAIPFAKRDLIYPAVLIGRLGVNLKFKRQHVGSELMDIIKNWFVEEDNKTGCRYLVVDAYNEAGPCEYYQKNGFAFMFSSEEQERQYRNISSEQPLHTRLMYFDLMQIVLDASATNCETTSNRETVIERKLE